MHRDGNDANSDASGSQAGIERCTGMLLMLIQMQLEARPVERGAQRERCAGTVLMLIQMHLEARQAERGAQGCC